MTPKGKPPLAAVLRELWAGIDAASAIRHGLPVPDAARAVRDRVTVRKGVVPFH